MSVACRSCSCVTVGTLQYQVRPSVDRIKRYLLFREPHTSIAQCAQWSRAHRHGVRMHSSPGASGPGEIMSSLAERLENQGSVVSTKPTETAPGPRGSVTALAVAMGERIDLR